MTRTSRIGVGTQFIFCLLFAGLLQAGTITSTLGDKDCFGIGGSCPDGSMIATGFDNQTAGDPVFTDKYDVFSPISYSHTYSLGGATILSAELEIRTLGIADSDNVRTRGPWDVLVGGTTVGQFPSNGAFFADQMVTTHLFSIPVGLLTVSSAAIILNTNVPDSIDGFAIDYSELRLTTSDSAVPEPGTLILFGAGLAGVVFIRKRHTPRA
jgi:hypothetical protein